jgi:hypothetical protein
MPSAAEPRCQEKLRLLVEYQRLTQEYSSAIGNMVKRGISKSEYDRLSSETDKARDRSIAARRRLAAHIVEHGC